MSKFVLSFCCAVCVAITQHSSLSAATWDNSSTDALWSTNTNWDNDLAIAGNPVVFGNVGTTVTAGTTTNRINSSVSVTSVSYASTSNFHTTQIDSDQTLIVSGGHFFVGPGGSGSSTTNVTIKGGTPGTGELNFDNLNTNFDFVVGRPVTAFSGTQNSTLDASDLGTLTIKGRFFDVGRINPNGAGDMSMAASNTVQVDKIRVGGWNNPGTIRLGTTNVIQADAIELGWQIENQGSSQARLQFDTGLTSPTVSFRNKAGNGRADLSFGWGSNGSGTGILDLTGGTVDGMFGTVILG